MPTQYGPESIVGLEPKPSDTTPSSQKQDHYNPYEAVLSMPDEVEIRKAANNQALGLATILNRLRSENRLVQPYISGTNIIIPGSVTRLNDISVEFFTLDTVVTNILDTVEKEAYQRRFVNEPGEYWQSLRDIKAVTVFCQQFIITMVKSLRGIKCDQENMLHVLATDTRTKAAYHSITRSEDVVVELATESPQSEIPGTMLVVGAMALEALPALGKDLEHMLVVGMLSDNDPEVVQEVDKPQSIDSKQATALVSSCCNQITQLGIQLPSSGDSEIDVMGWGVDAHEVELAQHIEKLLAELVRSTGQSITFEYVTTSDALRNRHKVLFRTQFAVQEKKVNLDLRSKPGGDFYVSIVAQSLADVEY